MTSAPLGYYTASAATDPVPIADAARRIARVLCWLAIGAGAPHVISVLSAYGGVHQHPNYDWPWAFSGFEGQFCRWGVVFGDFAGPFLVGGAVACLHRARGGRQVLLIGAYLLLLGDFVGVARGIYQVVGLGRPPGMPSVGLPLEAQASVILMDLAILFPATFLLALITRRAIAARLNPDPQSPRADAPHAAEAR